MSPAPRRVTFHPLEMVVAMLLGIVVLATPVAAALVAGGIDVHQIGRDLPAVGLVGMATVMAVPMVAWMRLRGHGWAPAAEMGALMFVPTVAAIGLLASGLVEDTGVLLMIQHVAMLPTMLVAMLLRRGKPSGHRQAHAEVVA